MQANTYSKYALRDLHEAIDLFDRKITYCQTYEKFCSTEEREKALQKLSTKRGSLVKTALALRSLGVEFEASVLPRSFRTAVADGGDPSPETTEGISAVKGAGLPSKGIAIVTSEPRQTIKRPRTSKKTTGKTADQSETTAKA